MSFVAEKVKEIYGQVLDEIKDDHLIKKYDLSSAAIVNELKKYEIRQGMIEFNQDNLNYDDIDVKKGEIYIPVHTSGIITFLQAEKIKEELEKNNLKLESWGYIMVPRFLKSFFPELSKPDTLWDMELVGMNDEEYIDIVYTSLTSERPINIEIEITYTPGLGSLVDKLAEILGIETEPKICKKTEEEPLY